MPAAADGVVPIAGDTAFALLRTAIAAARSRIWVTQFIVDARPGIDRRGTIRYLLHALAEAAHRGVDVRILLPVVEAPSGPPYDVNAPAARFLTARGVQVRRYSGSRQRPFLHAKLVIIDSDLLMVGNLNWTRRAAEVNTEQGLAVRDAEATATAAQRFDWLWRRRAHAAVDAQRTARRRNAPYWPTHRLRFDPHRPRSALGLELYGRLQGELSGGANIHLVAGQPYVRTLRSLMDSARKRILITMLGLRASTDKRLRVLLDSVKSAANRGLDVRILYQVVEGPRTDWTADIGELRAAAVPMRPWPMPHRMHMRAVIVDDEHAIVGSTAWTPQSIYLTEEMSIHARDAGLAEALTSRFEIWWSATEEGHESTVCTDTCTCQGHDDGNSSRSAASKLAEP